MTSLRVILFGSSLSALVACKGVNTFVPAIPGGGRTTPVVTTPNKVEAAYPFAADWNSYVANDGTGPLDATGAGCSTSIKTKSAQCLHAGELRRYALPSTVTSCAGITATDALGAFDWVCRTVGGTTAIYSTGLKSGKGLRDLIDGAAKTWRTNSLIVAGAYAETVAAAVWWPNNKVLPLPANAGATDLPIALGTTGAVYVTNAAISSRGYLLDADRVSLVTTDAGQISYVGTATANCNSTDGTFGSPDAVVLICGGAYDFDWIEVGASSAGAAIDSAVMLVGSKFARLNGSVLRGGWVRIGAGRAPRIDRLQINGGGLALTNVDGAFASRVHVAEGPIALSGADFTTLERAIVAGGAGGIQITNSSDGVFTRLTTVGTAANGVSVPNSGTSDRNRISFVTVINAGSVGVAIANGAGGVLHNVVTANSGSHGLQTSVPTSASHVAALNGGANGVRVGSSNNKFSGHLLVGNNAGANCGVGGGLTAPGLTGACAAVDASAGVLDVTTGLTAATAFLGQITTDDASNAGDVNGAVAAYPANVYAFDFVNFVTEGFRAWATDGSAFPNADHRGTWSANGGAGRIWDARLRTADATLRNVTGTGNTANAALVAGAACPAWLDGSQTITDVGGTHTFLANAFEVIGDYLGNDDGLCESNEACVAAPNFGAYQGERPVTPSSCTFTGGTVTGVQMQFYPTNGQ